MGSDRAIGLPRSVIAFTDLAVVMVHCICMELKRSETMDEIMSMLNDPVAWLVMIGAVLQATTCTFTNQVVLRVMLLAGSVHYLAYYFAAAPEPLSAAIIGTSTIAVGNFVGLIRVFRDRTRTCA